VEGWISLHRKIRKNPIFNDMELLRLWLICLTEATHKHHEQIVGRQTVHLEPGQFVTGRFDLQQMYNAGLKPDQQKSPKTVWRWLEALEKGEFLTINSTNKFSVISVLNWDKYQNGDHQSDQQVTNKRPTNDQQVTTNNNDNNDNNDNKGNKKDIVPYDLIISYLNQKTNSSYKSSSKATQRHIKARWNEGYRLADFQTVIDKKSAEWLSDPKMNQYLRPETLFGTKFENYLNQTIVLKGGQTHASRTDPRGQSNTSEYYATSSAAKAANENIAHSGNAAADPERDYFDQFVRRQ
jgi:uncharacterized phage protein (TIGR02220 family)